MAVEEKVLPDIVARRPIGDNEYIYTELKQLFMIGEFTPGQKLTLPTLAKAFGTSQMPIREATNRLLSARALIAPPRRSLCVPEATIDRMNSLLPMRLLLEGEATRLAVEKKGAAIVDELFGINQAMDAVVPKEDIKAYLRLNQQFHFLVYQSSGNEELIDLIELLWMRYGPMMNIVRSGVLSRSGHHRHMEVIEAFGKADSSRAAKAMQADISDAAIPIREAIEARSA